MIYHHANEFLNYKSILSNSAILLGLPLAPRDAISNVYKRMINVKISCIIVHPPGSFVSVLPSILVFYVMLCFLVLFVFYLYLVYPVLLVSHDCPLLITPHPPQFSLTVSLYSRLANTTWLGCYAIDINNVNSLPALDSK